MTFATTRVTQRSIADRVLVGLGYNQNRIADLQQKLSSGREISKPSDSPTGVIAALQMRGDVERNEAWKRNAQDGLTWLGTIDSAVTSSLDTVRRARELVIQGANTGTMGQQARESIATEIDKLRETLIGISNTTYLDRPVFGGTTSSPEAYDVSGTYLGDNVPTTRTVGPNQAVRVDVTGPEMFGTGPSSIFTILADVATSLRTPGSTTTAELSRLDGAMNVMIDRVADVGARYRRIEQAISLTDSRMLDLRTNISSVEDIDLPKTITDLALQNTAYQAALSATSKIVQPSLLDFLR